MKERIPVTLAVRGKITQRLKRVAALVQQPAVLPHLLTLLHDRSPENRTRRGARFPSLTANRDAVPSRRSQLWRRGDVSEPLLS